MIYGNIFCEDFSANRLFDYSNPRNGDGLFSPYIALREKLLLLGIEINTPDVNAERTVSFEIHMDSRPLANGNILRYLIAVENPLINPLNTDAAHLKLFRRVFSWNDASLIYPGAIRIFTPNVISVSEIPLFSNRKIFSRCESSSIFSRL